MNIKWLIYGVIALAVIGYSVFSGSDEPEMVNEEIVSPTQGLITTVVEVENDQFKIEDEQAVEHVDSSLIIAKYMDSSIDTFTLAEAKLAADTTHSDTRHRRNPVVRMASYGLMGFMLGRSMGSYSPRSSAYVDQNTYRRVTNNAGQSIQRTASRRTVSRPRSSTSGHGGTRSTRSVGG